MSGVNGCGYLAGLIFNCFRCGKETRLPGLYVLTLLEVFTKNPNSMKNVLWLFSPGKSIPSISCKPTFFVPGLIHNAFQPVTFHLGHVRLVECPPRGWALPMDHQLPRHWPHRICRDLGSPTAHVSSQNTELLENWELIWRNPKGSY